MTAMAAMDPRKRSLTILGGLAALFVVLAGLAVFQQSRSLAPKFEPSPLFPGLAAKLGDLGEIAVTSKAGTFHLKLMGDRWVIPEKDAFPADAALVRATGQGVADMLTLEPKTAREDWLSLIGLDDPAKGGAGVALKLSDKNGMALADIVLGNTQGASDELGRTTLYVRKAGENQSYLARSYITAKPNVADWLDRAVVPIARDRVKGATVTLPAGPAYTMVRDTKDQPDFRVLDLPRGRELSFPGSPDGVAGAITGFNFEDVAKADQVDFAKASQSVTNTFDGLTVTVKIAAKGMDHWATVSAAGSNPMTQEEAMRINARADGWAFKLPEMNVTQFTSSLETLLKPPPGK
jgi:hypothetical protein